MSASNVYPMNGGYTCGACGAWVAYGTFHSCTGTAGTTGAFTFDWAGYKQALEEIVNLLGPDRASCDENECEGCRYEMSEALLTALVALGRAQRKRLPPPHRRKPPEAPAG